VSAGYAPSATFVSSLKDANPAANRTPHWTSLTYSATTPAGTDVKFQVAASNAIYGPFNYIGPDGTAATFFATSGASLSQFDGFRYLRYKAYLTTGNSTITPTLSMVAVCFDDVLKVDTVGTIAVGTTPTGVAVGASKAYIANQGSNSVSVIDLTQSPPAVAATIPVGGMPDSAALSGDGSRLYVPNFRDGTLSIIATATNTVSHTVAVGSRPTGVVEVGGSVYVANLLSGTISVIDPVAGSVTRTISLPGAGTATGAAPSGLAASANGQRLYANDARNGRTYVIDLAQSPPVVGGFAAVGLRPAYLSLAGATGYVANPGSNSVSVLDLSQGAPVTSGSVTVGSSPYGVAAVAALKEVFVPNSGSNNLSVIDTTGAPTVAFTIATGAIPDGIALSPDQQTMVVSNEGDNTVSIFHVDQAPANASNGAQTAIENALPSADDQVSLSGTNQNPTADKEPGAAAVNGTPGVAQGPLGLVAAPVSG
jgi:YVTN family beta-propeller protein